MATPARICHMLLGEDVGDICHERADGDYHGTKCDAHSDCGQDLQYTAHFLPTQTATMTPAMKQTIPAATWYQKSFTFSRRT